MARIMSSPGGSIRFTGGTAPFTNDVTRPEFTVQIPRFGKCNVFVAASLREVVEQVPEEML